MSVVPTTAAVKGGASPFAGGQGAGDRVTRQELPPEVPPPRVGAPPLLQLSPQRGGHIKLVRAPSISLAAGGPD